MKTYLALLLSLLSLTTVAQKKYELKPDAQGYLVIRGTYKPGDTLQLRGHFKAVAVYDMFGAAGNPIHITNVPGQTLIIGDSLWSGGSWSHGLAVRNSRYLHVYGSNKDNFKIVGSNSATIAYGAPVRTAYFNFMITEMSDNFKVHDIAIRHGGVGILCKTDVSSNSKTWYPNTYLENFEFYNLDIYNTYNEAMYIGHTATYWNISNNTPVYTGTINPATMKQPIKLRNVSIHHNTLVNIGNDGIQTAAIDNLKIYDNEVNNWAANKNLSHNGGILIGGRVVNFEVYNNKLQDGYGEFLQIYADQGIAKVYNNLFVNNKLSGIGLRGGKGLVVEFTNNTIVNSGENAFRINGTGGGTGKNLIKKNIIVQPASRYIYLENGGAAGDEDNKKVKTTGEIGISSTTFLPVAGSASVGYGYSAGPVVIPDPEPPAKITITSNELAALFKALKPGTYSFEVGVDSVVKKVSVKVE